MLVRIIALILPALLLALGSCAARPTDAAKRPPNVVFVLVDDMGYGDLSLTGNDRVRTPNIDGLAAEGRLLTTFYVNSPVCSASRAALLTGHDPQRSGITSFLGSRAENRAKRQADFLPVDAPSLARAFKSAGYATAHFGKWHLGGGRDVGDAPLPTAYGFDHSLTTWEGLGDRLLIKGQKLSEQSARLGRGDLIWKDKHELTAAFVDRSIAFMEKNRSRPFFLQLWLTDVHDPWHPDAEALDRVSGAGRDEQETRMFAVLVEMDRQLGRLFDRLDALGLREDTIVILTSDNGPTAWPRYYEQGGTAPGSTAGMRGRKWSLYEGGIREPLIVRWPGRVPAGTVERASPVMGTDLFPTLARLAGLAPPAASDGIDVSEALVGRPAARRRALFWEYGSFGDPKAHIFPALARDRSPPLAMREGRWKLLASTDGGQVELYDLAADPSEQTDLAGQRRDIVRSMLPRLLGWRAGLRRDETRSAAPLQAR